MATSKTKNEPQAIESDEKTTIAPPGDIQGLPGVEPGPEPAPPAGKPEQTEINEETPLQISKDNSPEIQAETEKTRHKQHLKAKKANIKKSKTSAATKKSIKKARARKRKKTQPLQTVISSEHEDIVAGAKTDTESVELTKPETVEKNTSEELKHNKSALEEKSAEAANGTEVEEQAQAEQEPQEPTDSENTADPKSDAEESQLRQQDISSGENHIPQPETAEDVSEDPKADAESVEPQEPEAVEQSTDEELKQDQSAVEEKSAEAANGIEVEEQAQAEQEPQEPTDSENTADPKSDAEESQHSQQNKSSDGQDPLEPEAVESAVESAAPEPNLAANSETEVQAPTTETSDIPKMGEVSEAIRKLIQSSVLQERSQSEEDSTQSVIGNLLNTSASDIMQDQLTWASPEDSLQQAFAKMQQTDAGYIMIGRHGVLEGILSKSDIKKALSPYLLPIFAKWRRPLDDATLKIRIRWIMSRPVRTIKPQTPLATIMENMSQFRGRCLPVMDEKGKVRGLVTTFDIFRTLLKRNTKSRSEKDRMDEQFVESASPGGAE